MSGPPTPLPSRPAPPRRADLEQRIGAGWATWVGVIAILFALAFFLRWAFENNLVGPGARVTLGIVAGLGLLTGGLRLGRRADLPYLSEGLAGGGLGALYLSFYAAHVFYGLIGTAAAFYLMFLVTVTGTVVSLLSRRQITAMLALTGGLLTPVLLATGRPDERTLLGYLLVLDLLALGVARHRAWSVLPRLAWVGTALLVAPTVLERPVSPYPLLRVVLLTALFAMFVAVPLAREWVERRRYREADLLLIAANAAGYFWAVRETLHAWTPGADAAWVLGLSICYTALAAGYRKRVSDDEPTVLVHLAVAAAALTVGIALGLDGPWITVGWAAQGVVLLSVAPRLVTPVATWGGLAALLLAVARVVAFERPWSDAATPVFNATFAAHLGVVAALALAGARARALRPDQVAGLGSAGLQGCLWNLAALLLAVLLWREPTGLWPGMLLTAELLMLGWIAPRVENRAFLFAPLMLAATVLARVMLADEHLALRAAARIVHFPLLVRAVACGAIGAVGSRLLRSGVRGSDRAGRALSATAWVMLLVVLSVHWDNYQNVAFQDALRSGPPGLAGEIRWTRQVGMSILWTLYAALTLGWGFVRSAASVRYAALALFGLVILKAFLVDLAAVHTVYRIVSFLVLGLALLGVSALYQKVRRGP